MSKYFEIRWHGRGGQGTVTGAKSLAEAVQGTGKNISAFPEYGPERRGAPLKAFNRFSDDNIRIHTSVKNLDVVIIADPTLIGNNALTEGIKKNTIFIVNTEKPAVEIKKALNINGQTLFTVPANSISKKNFNKEIPNSAMLGTFAKACEHIISLEDLVKESKHIFSKMLGASLVDKNIEAIKEGYRFGDVVYG